MATGADEGAKALVPLIKDHRMRPMRWSCFDTTVIHREGHSHTMSLFITFVQGKCDPSWFTRRVSRDARLFIFSKTDLVHGLLRLTACLTFAGL